MKYHHDRLHPREPRPDERGAAPVTGQRAPTAGAVTPEFLQVEGSPLAFEQARCQPPADDREDGRPGANPAALSSGMAGGHH